MTTRRGRVSNSGQPGSRAWRESIQSIKRELNANDGALIRIVEDQEKEKAQEVHPLFEMAASLQVAELLSFMNKTLLDSQGVIQTILRWEEGIDLAGEDEEEEDHDDEDWDDDDGEIDDDDEEEEEEGTPFLFVVLSVILTWKEAGRIQIKVDIQDDDEEEEVEVEMRVNGRPVSPPTARNLQNGLVRAFREQMDEDYGQFEES